MPANIFFRPFAAIFVILRIVPTRLISCSPASEAVMSLQSAWRAGGGRPERRDQTGRVHYSHTRHLRTVVARERLTHSEDIAVCSQH